MYFVSFLYLFCFSLRVFRESESVDFHGNRGIFSDVWNSLYWSYLRLEDKKAILHSL